ncbi:MAG: DUF2231 domain-containing protein [Acidimicrobiales bacterium]
MFVAIVSGLIDRSRGTTAGTRARARSSIHGLVMAGLTLGSMLALTLRGTYPDSSHTPAGPLAATLALVVLSAVGGELGGRLTYRAGVNVTGRAGAPGVPTRTP